MQLGAGRSRKKRAARVRARKRCKSDADFSQLSSVLQAASLPRGGGRPECARSRLGPPADRFLTLMRVMLSQPTKRHNESNETVTPHRSGAGQRTGVCSTCQPAQRNEADGFGQRCARGRNARRHRLSGRPGGARTHPRPKTPSRARRERRERAAEKSPRRRAREHYASCCVAARGRESTRSDDARERSHTHAKKHTVRPSAKGRQPALPRHRERF